VKSLPPAAVFFPRFLLGIQKKSGRRGQWQYIPQCTARIPRHFAMQNDCPLYKGAICVLRRSKKAPLTCKGSCRPQGRLRGFEGIDNRSSCLPHGYCPSPPVRLKANHLPLARRGGFTYCAARIPQSFCRAKCQPPLQGGHMRTAPQEKAPLEDKGSCLRTAQTEEI